MRELGYDQETGLTRTAIQLNQRTGMPMEGTQGTNEDEAIHLGILTKVLDGQASDFYSVEEAVSILGRKLSHLQIKATDSTDIYWSLYALQYVLETKFPSQQQLLNIVEGLLATNQSFADKETGSLLFGPYLADDDIKEMLYFESRDTMTPEALSGLYLAGHDMAAIWHHNYLLGLKT